MKGDPESPGSLHNPMTEEGPEWFEEGRSCLSPEEVGLKSRERQKGQGLCLLGVVKYLGKTGAGTAARTTHLEEERLCGLLLLCSTELT